MKRVRIRRGAITNAPEELCGVHPAKKEPTALDTASGAADMIIQMASALGIDIAGIGREATAIPNVGNPAGELSLPYVNAGVTGAATGRVSSNVFLSGREGSDSRSGVLVEVDRNVRTLSLQIACTLRLCDGTSIGCVTLVPDEVAGGRERELAEYIINEVSTNVHAQLRERIARELGRSTEMERAMQRYRT